MRTRTRTRAGVSGSGSACGAVLGSLTAINLIVGEDYKPLASDTANQYAVDGEYTAHEYLTESLPQSVAGSIDCDDSRGTWVHASGYDMSSAEREERCSRLTGDVAAKAVLILNEGHVHRVFRNGRVVGYAGIGEASGYKTNIVVAVGIGLDGRIDAVSGATVSSETTAKIVREQGKHLQRYQD